MCERYPNPILLTWQKRTISWHDPRTTWGQAEPAEFLSVGSRQRPHIPASILLAHVVQALKAPRNVSDCQLSSAPICLRSTPQQGHSRCSAFSSETWVVTGRFSKSARCRRLPRRFTRRSSYSGSPWVGTSSGWICLASNCDAPSPQLTRDTEIIPRLKTADYLGVVRHPRPGCVL